MFFSRQTDKLYDIHTTKYYSIPKRNQLPNHKHIWRTLKCILSSERSQSEGYIVYGHSYRTFWKRRNYCNSRKVTGSQRVGGKGWGNRWNTEDSSGSETIATDIVCQSTRNRQYLRMNPNVNYGLWVIMMYPSGRILVLLEKEEGTSQRNVWRTGKNEKGMVLALKETEAWYWALGV